MELSLFGMILDIACMDWLFKNKFLYIIKQLYILKTILIL